MDQILIGTENDDILVGGSGNDTLDGRGGNDLLTGNKGNDNLNGGTGTDRVVESGDINFTLTNTVLGGLGIDNLIGIENATLTGGASDNRLSASDFTVGTVILNGEAGNDRLIGGFNSDILSGGDGDDLLTGKEGDDIINAGNGIDTVTGKGDINFTLTDRVLAGLGLDNLIDVENAVLTGGAGNNTLDARNFTLGSVNLNGEGGDDRLIGGFNNDTLNGGYGDDLLTGKEGNDVINGGNGLDTVTGKGDVNFTLTNNVLGGLGIDNLIGIENAVLTGGAGNNRLSASDFTLGSVNLNGEGGNDRLIGGFNNDTLNGGGGEDVLTGKEGNDVINGGNGIDTVTGKGDVNFTLTNNVLGGLGIDTLIGIENARLTGGAGNNTLDARNFTLGTVNLQGERGDDRLIGGFNDDVLNGGDGDDLLTGKEGDDVINGESGIDTVTGKADVDFTLTDNLLTGLGSDLLIDIERAVLTGGEGDNTLDASMFTLGSVSLDGGAGNDRLIGGDGNDILNGGDGNDTLRGAGTNNGVGSIDTLTGGRGSSNFVNNFVLGSSTTAYYNDGDSDTAGIQDYALITDFNSSLDTIQLQGSSNLYVLGSSPMDSVAGTGIFRDSNSNGTFNSSDELIAIARGSANLSLTASYFTYV